ncbi:DNA polymerase III subunit delta' [Thermodesulfobacteriota bacterium]
MITKFVPGFHSLIDQQRPIRTLTTLLRKGTIPHALLFTGIDGVGRMTAAMTFAMACNCSSLNAKYPSNNRDDRRPSQDQPARPDPCLHCKSCRKIKTDNHPDVLILRPSGPYIRIGQIRSLHEILAMKPYEARVRVVIIFDAHSMNPQAGNALLKILEEPPDRTHLILIASQTSDLLPTIVSRCQHIRFNPVSQDSLEAWLVEKKDVAPDEAAILASMANGSISKALSMREANWITRRNWLINEVEHLPEKMIGSVLAFAEKLTKNKERLHESLEIIKVWLRDLAVYKFDPEKIMNKDLTLKIQYASQEISIRSIISKIESIQTTQKNLRGNTNLRLTLEIMALRLANSQAWEEALN